MKKTILSLMFVPLLGWAQIAPQKITIGFIPGIEPQKLQSNSLKLATELQKKLGINVEVYISKNYSGLVDAMKKKKIDFAFFSAMTFVFAEKEAGAKVLLKNIWDSPFYHSTVIVRKDSGINSFKDLKGKTFAFVDERSASGYLYPLSMMRSQGLDEKKFFKTTKFSGNHAMSSQWVSDKKIDAAAVYANDAEGKSGAWHHYLAASDAEKIRVLWTSDPIPNDPFCVRQDFYEKFPRVTHDLMFALIDLSDPANPQNAMKSLFNVTRMDMATSRQYEPVRELVRLLKLPPPQ